MLFKGVNYDVGIFPLGQAQPSRVNFDRRVVRRELEIIRHDLHCDAVRITGRDIDRLVFASECALEQGLAVWFSPALHDATPRATLAYLADCATAAETLRLKTPNIVFVAGWELTFFMSGLVLGASGPARMQTFMKPQRLLLSTLLKGPFPWRLNRFLKRAVALIRKQFRGPVTYAAGLWEPVDWQPFDFVAIDCYRDAHNARHFSSALHEYFQHGKPVVISEFGCCTYRGAAEKGSYAWTVVDWSRKPAQLQPGLVRDEREQSQYLTELFTIFAAAGVAGVFAFTFVAPKYPHHAEPARDLDMASYALVKSFADRNGERYPDLPWEPKVAFDALAARYSQS